jgi:YHS domain-containing protein
MPISLITIDGKSIDDENGGSIPHRWDGTQWIIAEARIQGDKILVNHLLAEKIYSSGATIGGFEISPNIGSGKEVLRLGNNTVFEPKAGEKGILLGADNGKYKLFVGDDKAFMKYTPDSGLIISKDTKVEKGDGVFVAFAEHLRPLEQFSYDSNERAEFNSDGDIGAGTGWVNLGKGSGTTPQTGGLRAYANTANVKSTFQYNPDPNSNRWELDESLLVKKDLTVDGKLNIKGTIDRYNQSELNIGDGWINLASEGTANIDAGIKIKGAGGEIKSTLFFDESENKWKLDKGIEMLGKVGILTNDIPSDVYLRVQGSGSSIIQANSSGTTGISVAQNGVNKGYLWHHSTNGYLGVGPGSVANSILFKNNNIGIGNANPTHKLDVTGDINLTGNLKQNGNVLYPRKRSAIDLRSEDPQVFYPVILHGGSSASNLIEFQMSQNSQGGSDPYNNNTLIGWARAQGWSDMSYLYWLQYSQYDSNERTILGLYRTTRLENKIILYLRGGELYYFSSEANVNVYKTGYNTGTAVSDNSVCMLKNSSGNDITGQSDSSQNIQRIVNLHDGGEGIYFNENVFRQQLSVEGNIRTVNAANKLVFANDDNNYYLGAINSNEGIKGNSYLGWSFYGRNNLGIRINEQGKVGIGISSPAKELQINNSTNTPTLRIGGTNAADFSVAANGSLTINADVGGSDGNLKLNARGKEHIELTGTGTTIIKGTISTDNFQPGFAGTGNGSWQISQGSESQATFDNITVRKSMKVYELEINKIRSGNGSYWFSDGCKLLTASYNGSSYYVCTVDIDIDKGETHPFKEDDIVRCQVFNGKNQKNIELIVNGVDYYKNSGRPHMFELLSSSDVGLVPGDEIVRVGNKVDTNRQGAVYITSNDDNAPYIDVTDGYKTVGGAFSIKARLGKLDGIVDTEAGLDGSLTNNYGLYSQNVFLKGKIVANGGKIAGWDIAAEGIYSIQNGRHISLGKANAWTSAVYGFQVGENTSNRIWLGLDTSTGHYELNVKKEGADIVRLGSNINKIADWSIEPMLLKSKVNSSGGYVRIYSTDSVSDILVTSDGNLSGASGNFVQLFSTPTTYGLNIKKGGKTVAQLGSTNQIAGWDFSDYQLYSTSDGYTIRAINAKGTGEPRFEVMKDSQNYVRMFYARNGSGWGIRGVQANNAVFQLGSLNKIAGWSFDHNALYSGSAKETSGYTSGGMTISASGAIHAKNFYIDSNGNVAARNAVFEDVDIEGRIVTGFDFIDVTTGSAVGRIHGKANNFIVRNTSIYGVSRHVDLQPLLGGSSLKSGQRLVFVTENCNAGIYSSNSNYIIIDKNGNRCSTTNNAIWVWQATNNGSGLSQNNPTIEFIVRNGDRGVFYLLQL